MNLNEKSALLIMGWTAKWGKYSTGPHYSQFGVSWKPQVKIKDWLPATDYNHLMQVIAEMKSDGWYWTSWCGKGEVYFFQLSKAYLRFGNESEEVVILEYDANLNTAVLEACLKAKGVGL